MKHKGTDRNLRHDEGVILVVGRQLEIGVMEHGQLAQGRYQEVRLRTVHCKSRVMQSAKTLQPCQVSVHTTRRSREVATIKQ